MENQSDAGSALQGELLLKRAAELLATVVVNTRYGLATLVTASEIINDVEIEISEVPVLALDGSCSPEMIADALVSLLRHSESCAEVN